MANKTKYSKTVISEILSELAQGKSIRSCLSPINKLPERPCWETFRTWMRDTSKYPNLRAEYENAKTDGIEYLLSDAQDLLNESIIDKIIEIGKLCDRPSLDEIQEGRIGSVVLRPNLSDNTITINLAIEESSDLIEWKPIDQIISTTLPLNEDKKFYRFAAE